MSDFHVHQLPNDNTIMDEEYKLIEELETKILNDSISLLKLKNEWLIKKGWDVSCQLVDYTDTYYYKKDDEFFICEDCAIGMEIHGDDF